MRPADVAQSEGAGMIERSGGRRELKPTSFNFREDMLAIHDKEMASVLTKKKVAIYL